MIFDWDDANRRHVARHNISPEEFEQVMKNGPLDVRVQYDEDDGMRFEQVGEPMSVAYLPSFQHGEMKGFAQSRRGTLHGPIK